LDTGNWSTAFQKEIRNMIIDISKLEYRQNISYSDKKRGIYVSNCAGFEGLELKNTNKKIEFFDKYVYEKYVTEFITITNDPKNKVARKELLEHFIVWVKNNNFISKQKIMCKTSISSIFKDVFIENIENITGLKIQDVCKLTYFGCFIGMRHCEFPYVGKEFNKKENLSNDELVKKQVDNWIDNKTTKISKIFMKCLQQDNKISDKEVKEIMNSKFNIDISLNTRKTRWHLIFGKDVNVFYIKPEAFEYANSKINNK